MRLQRKLAAIAATSIGCVASLAAPALATIDFSVSYSSVGGGAVLTGSGHWTSAAQWIFNGNLLDNSRDNSGVDLQIYVVDTSGLEHVLYYKDDDLGYGKSVGVGFTQNPAPYNVRTVVLQLAVNTDIHGTNVNDALNNPYAPHGATTN